MTGTTLAVKVCGRAASFHTWNLDGIASSAAAAADDFLFLFMFMVHVHGSWFMFFISRESMLDGKTNEI